MAPEGGLRQVRGCIWVMFPHLRARSWRSIEGVTTEPEVVGMTLPDELEALDARSIRHLRVPVAGHS